jgi:hypothetical protein
MMDWCFDMRVHHGRRWLVVGCALLSMALLSGCSLQKITVNQTADVLWEGRTALESEPDPQFARDAMPASLKTLETFLESAPDNRKLLRMLAKGYFSYSFAFLEEDIMRMQAAGASSEEIDEVMQRAVLHYMKSHRYGLRLLDDEEFEKAATDLNLDKVEKLLKEMDEEDVPGLFWTGYGWGSAANLAQSNTDMVAALPVVEAIMKRVVELEPGFFYSGAPLFFGVYYGSRPPMFGGNPDLAKKYFEQAMRQHGDKNLLIPALYARFYATAPGVQDRELFERLLTEVLEADASKHPKLRLNNEIAKRRAEFWLQRIDDLFY